MDHPEMNQINMALAIAFVLLVAGSVWVVVKNPQEIIRDPSPAPTQAVSGWSNFQSPKAKRLKALVRDLK